MTGIVTRLAPTPSGALHPGNAYSFLAAWTLARAGGGRVVLRIEDVDTTRARPDWIESVFRDLEWLGLDWDAGPAGPSDLRSPYRQSSPDRQERYRSVWTDWRDRGLLYPCRCTRADLRLDAPQVDRIGDDLPPGVPYSGRCRSRRPIDADSADAWRLALPDIASRHSDLWLGPRNLPSLAELGDPVLRRGDGCTAYHLAVCVDDADQGVTHVVRGRDLAPFAPLHRHLQALLGSASDPVFCHHGLLGDPEGRRLAKRIGSGSLSGLRESGTDPRLVVGRLGALLHPDRSDLPRRCTPRELATFGVPRPDPSDRNLPSFEESP